MPLLRYQVANGVSTLRRSIRTGFRFISATTLRASGIDPTQLEIILNKNPKSPPPSKSLVFGHTFTDHMLTIPWSLRSGWGVPRIEPYGPLSLDPSATVLHYAQTLFEGLKAYRDKSGKVTLFRPDMNMRRMNDSARRLAMPTFDGDILLNLIKQLILTDKEWIPREPGHSLYIRPTFIGTQNFIGVAPPTQALLFVICSPVGPYYPQGFKPVALYGTTEYSRAAPGGTGAYKLGLNYAPGVMPQKKAAALGYVQNLWLQGPEHYLTEVGTMNLFVVLKKDDGATELVTPPLDGMILPGVTRDSVLALAREHIAGLKRLPNLPDSLVVSERPVTMKEVQTASQTGSLVELFGTGTAAVISPVDRIGYMGNDIHIPTGEDGMGPVSRPLWKELVGRQTGAIPSDWSVIVSEVTNVARWRYTLETRPFATVHKPTIIAPPPQTPDTHPKADLDDQILSTLSETQEGIPELIEQYVERSGHVLDASLPYEPQPSEQRRVHFDGSTHEDAVVMIAHCIQRGLDYKMTMCSGFALDCEGRRGTESFVLTCAHTLEEIRRSPLLQPDARRSEHFSSGSFVISGFKKSLSIRPVSTILSALQRSDLILLSKPGPFFKSLPVCPYPAQPNTPIRAHFVADRLPNEPGWKPWVGGMWSKWVRGTILGYRDFAGRETQPGTYDALSHLFFDPPPTSGASGGPIVDEKSGAVVGVMLGTMVDNAAQGVRGWGVPSETIFEMFCLPGMKDRIFIT